MQKVNFYEDGRHQESQETVDFICKFDNSSLPYSVNDGWGRFGMLGVLGDMIIQSLPDTHIVEIGTGESSIYLTQVAKKYGRKIFYCDEARGKITNPLTIPGYLHPNTVLVTGSPNYSEYEHYRGVAYVGQSDDFFRNIKLPPIGLAFIDGEHHYEYVKRDFENIFERLVPDGYIFLHDCYPHSENLVLNDYCADSYKMRQELEHDSRVDCFTFTKLVAVNVGFTMVRKKPLNRPYYQQ